MRYIALVLSILFIGFSAHAAETVSGCKGGGIPHTVADKDQLATALKGAAPGTTIVLRPGSYGDFEVKKPLFIAAQNLAVVKEGDKLKRAASGLSVVGRIEIKANNVTLCGLSFQNSARNVTTDGYDNLKLLRNSIVSTVFTGAEQSFFLTRSNGLVVSENIFSAYPPAGETLAYGLAIFYVDSALVKGNIFDGVYDHQFSIKRNDGTIRVENNRFIGCGHVCVQVGQTYDFDHTDTTTKDVKLTGNSFEARYTSHSQFFGIAVAVQNTNDLLIENNRFSAGFTQPIQAFYAKKGGYLSSEGRKIGNYGINARRTVIKNNNFASGRLMLEGRGTGANENIALNGNNGSADCKVTGFQTHGVPDNQIDWHTIDNARPTVTQSGNSFHCS